MKSRSPNCRIQKFLKQRETGRVHDKKTADAGFVVSGKKNGRKKKKKRKLSSSEKRLRLLTIGKR